MTTAPYIIATKKLPPALSKQLTEAGLELFEADFISTQSKDFEWEKPHQNLIFTSQNAVASVLKNARGSELKTHPVFCVGQKTKTLLEQNGFEVVVDTDYAADLAEIIALVHRQESFTFFSGNLRRDILPQTLWENGITYNEIEVYQTTLLPQKVKGKPDGILFFSPSAVASYLKSNKITDQACFCIGETTAEVLEALNIERISIAQTPSVEAVISDAIAYFTT